MVLKQTHQASQSDIAQHIYNLIQQGEVFAAKYQLQLINRTNGYEVISKQEFKRWHIEHLKNMKSSGKIDRIKSDAFHNEYAKAYMKLISN